MDFEILAIPALIVVATTAILLLPTSDWRLSIMLLAIQYVGVFFLIAIYWPFQMALVKLVAGWIAGTVLGLAVISNLRVRQSLEHSEENTRRGAIRNFFSSGHPFQLLAAGLVALFMFFLASQLNIWLPEVSSIHAFAGLLLIGMGLLKLGFYDHPLMIIIGLLTVLAGFEIIYSSLESSALVAGLLAINTMGIALMGAYLLTSPYFEEVE